MPLAFLAAAPKNWSLTTWPPPYTKASQMNGLSAESSYRLQKVGGEVLGMLN
jgi:hypothetical protein